MTRPARLRKRSGPAIRIRSIRCCRASRCGASSPADSPSRHHRLPAAGALPSSTACRPASLPLPYPLHRSIPPARRRWTGLGRRGAGPLWLDRLRHARFNEPGRYGSYPARARRPRCFGCVPASPVCSRHQSASLRQPPAGIVPDAAGRVLFAAATRAGQRDLARAAVESAVRSSQEHVHGQG